MSHSIVENEETGLKYLRMNHSSGAVVEVQFHGATITKYRTSSGRDVLYLSEKAIFDGTKAIRGGIPIVFPQFLRPNPHMPSHGFARISSWNLLESIDKNDTVSATFEMRDTEDTMKLWNHAFNLRYLVELSATFLKTTLFIKNTGDEKFDCQALLHSYFKVNDIADVAVEGLQHLLYQNQIATSNKMIFEEAKHKSIQQEIDNIYLQSSKVILHCRDDQLTLMVSASSCDQYGNEEEIETDLVLWNPWEIKTSTINDLPPLAYREFVCIEPGVVSCMQQVDTYQTLKLCQTIISNF